MPETGVTQTHRLVFIRQHNARRAVRNAPKDEPVDLPAGRLPRIVKLMALAIRFDHLLATGAVLDQAELADLGHVTRARVTQIMNLLHLASDIQEEIIFLPRVTEGRDPIAERNLRRVTAEIDWGGQRKIWEELKRATG